MSWLGMALTARAQQSGYIYLHNRSFNEESAINFTYSVSGGPTNVSSLTLNDQAATQTPITGLGGGAGGGLWALAGAANGGNYAVYYRAPNTATWANRTRNRTISLTSGFSNIDGGSAGAFIGIVQVAGIGRVYYDNGTSESDVSGNLALSTSLSVTDVSDNWQGTQYVVLSNNQVWKRSISSTTWTQISNISARSVDAIPNTTQLIYKNASTEEVIRINNDGTGSTNLGFPANAGGGTEIAASENGTIVAKFGAFTYRYTGTGWAIESTSQNLGYLTGGPFSQIWSRLPMIADRIFSRTEAGNYLSDENVRTSPNDNSALIAVAPGTYTITEAAVQGWDLNSITFYETQSPSSSNVATNTASVVVSAGEVVHVVFENALVQTTAISNVCSTSATFTETFGTGTGYGGPLVGLTGYHLANGSYGFGYYSLANTTSLMGGYAGNFTDHTGDTNGRMLAVDATSEPGVFYRRRFTGLLQGGIYTFSAWAMNVNTQGATDLPNISFEVYDPDSGTLISSGNSGNISAVGVWQQTSLLFTANQTTVDLVLRNNTLGTSGNDLAIDDISFGVAIPLPTVQKTDATCSTAGSLTVASPVSTGYEYSINGTTYQTSPVFANVAPGTYSITARYAASAGCVSPARAVTVAISNASSFTAALTSATIANGTSATLTASSGDANSNYRFSTGQTGAAATLVVSPTTNGSNPYSVTATSSQGCTATASATVTVVLAPVPTSLTISGQPNPGGTVGVTVPPASFTGTIASGTITRVRYATFPSNVNSFTIGSTVYTSANFPAGGVTATVGTSVRIDPVDGAVTATIPFRLISSANIESTTTGTVGVPFLTVTDFCNSQVLFFNEDFGAGVGFGPPLSTSIVPGYTYRDVNPINDGQYGIVNDPDQGDDFATPNVWLHGPDHTGNPNGRMLLINGSNPAQVAYSQPVSGLVIGRFYSLRTYLTNVFSEAVLGTNNIKPNITLRVSDNNNNVLASVSTGDIPTRTTLTWIPYSMSFTASTNSVKFELVSNAPAGGGNDYAIDDIQFFELIQPVLSTTAVTSVCPATSASLASVTASNQPPSTTLTWHSSATATAANRIADVTALRSGTYYAAFFDGTCYTKASPVVVLIVPCANPDAGLTVSSAVSSTVVANVAANDFVNGQAATLGTNGNATVATVGTYPTGVTLDPTTGSLSVAAGTAPGSYTVSYQLCDKLTPVNCTTAIATFTVTPIISGTVYNDGNGLTDSQINGTGTNAGGLFAILTNAASTSVLASAPVSSNGVYSFTGLSAGTYSVRLSTTSAVVGTTPPAVSVPTGYTTTGEGIGTASDGTPDGITPVTLTNTASQTAVSFGLNRIPAPTSATLASQVNPGGLTSVAIPPASFTGTDADGTVAAIRYTTFPSNVNSITIGNTLYILNAGTTIPVGAVVFPAGGVTATAGTTVSVDPVDGNVIVVIPFRVIDNAGVESTTATTGSVSIPFAGLAISGTVLNDGNGLTDNAINGTGTNAGGLFVNLVNGSGNVVASQSVPTSGVYSFTGVAAGTYNVQLSTTTVATGSSAPAVTLPTGWTFTGEGTAAAGDGTPNGITSVTVTTASSTGVNFGIDQLPVPTSATLTAQANPGGTNAISVPPTSFTGTDADGSVTAIRYTTFPTNVTSLTIGSTVYTSFPTGGVTALTGSTVLIDPVDGPITVSIPFRVIDNARQESTATGTISVPFTYVVTASPDAGTVSAGTGGTPVVNVAANDLINGQPATLGTGGNAAVAQVGTYPTGVTLNPSNGSISVAAGTTPGSFTVAYQLCDKLSPATCTTAIVSVTVTSAVTARPDAGTVSAGTGGTPVANVVTNDVVNGQPANLATNAIIAAVGTYPAGISLNTTTGSVSVAQGTTPGSYTVAYQLCDRLTPATCSTAIVSITVTASSVANPDAGTVSSGTSGTAVANVAANDLVNGQPATLGTGGNATVTQVGTYPAGVTLDPTTGSLTVAQGTTPGSYTIAYQLCDKLTPVTCTTTTVSFIVTASEVANPDAGTVSSGTGGTPIANVVANDVVNGLPATLGTNGNATVTLLTTGTPLVLNTNTGSVSVAQGTTPGVYTAVYQLCDKITPVTCTTGTISVTVTAAEVANPDAGTVSAGNGGVVVANVAANDMVNGLPATLGTNGNATIAQVGTYPAGVTLDTATGALSVAAGTAPGSYTVAYQLCDKISPVTCTTGLVSFTITPGVGGTVFNDANGLTDNQINGPGTNAGGLFVILTNSANTVVASVPVATTGAYRFDNVAPGSYSVRISTAAGTVGGTPPAVSLPANWTTTGEGTTAAGDGLVNGITAVTVGSAEVSGANFGIEQLPTPTTTALAARSNPGGTNAITVPPSSLTGTDPDGTVVAIRFVSFPTNVTTLFIGSTAYTAATFPAGGITAASNVPVHIDPTDGTNGAVASVISFRVIDNAGMESPTTGTATLSFSCPDALCVPVTIQKIRTR